MQRNVELKQYSTMQLGGPASYLVVVESQEQLIEVAANAKANNIPVIVVGEGSNIVWRDEGFNGLVIVNRIKGFNITSNDEFGTYLTVGAGENWDSVVERSVEQGLSGIECLSLIPGTAGATPVQNVGAYGQEIAETLVTITAYDQNTGTLVTLAAGDCKFTYRKSIFNTTAKGRYLITAITLMLSHAKPMPPFYQSISDYLEKHKITDYTPSALRKAVIEIRRAKLPDPAVTANCGSFFANPEVDSLQLAALQDSFPAIPNWPTDDGQVKLSAAWLIDQAGYHDYFDPDCGIATWPTQALVFVNRSAKSTADLLRFADKVKAKVKDQFSVELKMEPLLLP
ncbi:MAG: UDP-N-acetylmuramate dehydrogenase [Candidatus Saccharimonadales bacterium]